jgi:uncharacterized cupredoxin-like copper-binding protein
MRTMHNRREFVAALALAGTSVVPISLAIANAQETPAPSASPQASPAASPAATPVAVGPPPQTAVTLELFEFGFNPNEFTIPANTDVPVTLQNTGVVLHTFTVTDHNQFPNVPDLGVDTQVQTGEPGMATVNAPVGGDYYFYCRIPGHEEAGMHGVMHVQ